jgi:DNA-binding SARP family transcriptional activator/Flp pilus assembly protein TadD
MEFRLLGPVEAVINGESVNIVAPRQQIILALLLLEAGNVVSVDRIVDALWSDAPPTTARSQVYITVSALRRHIGEAVIVTQPPGYIIKTPPGTCDVARFDELIASAVKEASEQRIPEAVRALRAALALWRGPALDGVQSEVIEAAATRLNERRISAYQDCVDLELRLGQHQEIIGELTELVSKFPLNEHIRGQLMLALYRAGRQADALDVFRAAREVLHDELGLDPGAELSRLAQAILAQDPQLNPPTPQHPVRHPGKVATTPVPRQLPRTIADFTGREDILAEVSRVLTCQDANAAVPEVPLVLLTGRGGVGKTALAVRAAHVLSPEFPDGQLFLQLRSDVKNRAEASLEYLLRSFGTPPDSMPPNLEGRMALYRSMLAGLRVLIVIDGAANQSQIAPFLPGAHGSGAIVTSSQHISGLEDVHQIQVGPLDEQSATSLLENLVGAKRVAAEPESVRDLVRLCEGIPLALRVVAAKLAVRPHWPISHMVTQLLDETRRLDELDLDGASVRATIAVAYETLDESAQRLLKRLSMIGAADFASWVSAPLLDVDVRDAEDLLLQLVAAHLVEATMGPDEAVRFHLHDLVRIYAVERLTDDEATVDRLRAVRRLLGCYLFIATTARRRIYGGDFAALHGTAEQWPLPEDSVALLLGDPFEWFRSERNSLVTAISEAARLDMDELCWDLACTAVTLFESGAYGSDWRDSHASALDAVRRAGNKRGEAALLYSLGTLETSMQLTIASSYLEKSLKIFYEIGDAQGRALALHGLGLVGALEGDYDEAQARCRQALDGFRKIDDPAGQAYTLKTMAQISADLPDYAAAEPMLDEALAIGRRLGVSRLTAQIQYALAELQLRRGRLEAAADGFSSVLRLTQESGDIVGQAFTLACLGNARCMLGDFDGAESALSAALDLAGRAGNRLIRARSVLGLAEVNLARGEDHLALVRTEEAVSVFREHGRRGVWHAKALELLGRIHRQAGRLVSAAHSWQEALMLVGESDSGLHRQITESLARLQAANPE